MKKIKLFNVPRRTKINVEHLGISIEGRDEILKELFFHSMDGMFGRCSLNDKELFLGANTEVFIKEEI